MANTYSQIYIQFVFAVKHRKNHIPTAHKDRIYKFIATVIANRGQKSLAINGMEDHIHILVGLRPNINMSDLVKDIKTRSTLFINKNPWLGTKFRWQNGFGAFSYSKSQLGRVINYISNQEEHHRKKTFRQEYIDFLKKFEVKYDDEFLFEFYDN